jgi:hypothetical protein
LGKLLKFKELFFLKMKIFIRRRSKFERSRKNRRD